MDREGEGNMARRIIIIVLDSVGIGEMPDAEAYGDRGSNTLGNIARLRGGLRSSSACKTWSGEY